MSDPSKTGQSEPFTPGPWRLLRGQWNRTEQHLMSVGSIFGTQPDHDWFIATMENAPEQEANARLIAAAPDLLAALEWLHNAMDEGGYVSTGGSGAAMIAARNLIRRVKSS